MLPRTSPEKESTLLRFINDIRTAHTNEAYTQAVFTPLSELKALEVSSIKRKNRAESRDFSRVISPDRKSLVRSRSAY